MYGSFLLMSVFDLIIVAAVIFACVKLYQDRSRLQDARRGVYLLTTGLILLGFFYLLDLFLMWVAPSLFSMQVAMNWMDALHLEFNWIVSLIAVLCLASGTAIVVNSLLHVEEKLKTEIEERQLSEGEKQKLIAQLYHNQKIEALGTLAGGIAHDFNNIITVILNNAEMMKIKKEQNLDTEDSVNNIIKSSERAAGLVKQILTYSRMESVVLQPINLGKEVKAALAMVRATIPANVKISTDIDENLPMVSGDATQISQIIINLCTNANHAIGEKAGEINVRVQSFNEFNENNYVVVTIEDNGCGIDADCLDRIFDPFFTTKEVDKGTGLGLSAVHGIVENHSAKIEVESEISIGTKFTIKFPLSEDMQAVTPVVAIPDVRKNGSILLVEDDTEIGDLYRQHLLSKGHQVTYCTSGDAALQSFESKPTAYDLVITDQAMPALTGKQLAEKVLRLRPEIPIILMTGYSDDISEEGAEELGIKNFLFKPVGFKELDASVARCL